VVMVVCAGHGLQFSVACLCAVASTNGSK